MLSRFLKYLLQQAIIIFLIAGGCTLNAQTVITLEPEQSTRIIKPGEIKWLIDKSGKFLITNIDTSAFSNLTYADGIFVKAKKRLEKVLLKDILWVEAYDIYAMIKTPNGQYLLSHSLKTVEERFPSSHFIRVHRSYLVNKDKIDAIEESDLVIADAYIPVGKTYRDGVMKKLAFL